MKNLVCLFAAFIMGSGLWAQSEVEGEERDITPPAEETKADEASLQPADDTRDWIVIDFEALPEEAQNDVNNRYHGPDVLKVWKTMKDGKPSAYLIEVEKPGKRWTVEYDAKGNPVNTISPN